MRIRRHHNDGSGREKRREQPVQDGGVGDVDDKKLVQAKQVRLRRDRLRHSDRRVFLCFPARYREPPMHFRHELVEMGAALVPDSGRAEEKVHEHGLAAANSPEDVKALGHLATAPGEEREEVGPGRRRIID